MLHYQPSFTDSPNDLHAYPSSPKDLTPRSPYLSSSHRVDSFSSGTLDDILAPGDFVQEGGYLQGELIRRVSLGSSPRGSLDACADAQPTTEFQVIRRLGTGSYAVVYLVREVLSRPPSSPGSDESGVLGSMDLDGSVPSSPRGSVIYGREYAIKCLSKANLDEEQLAAQMTEVTIHQSLNSHPNIVTLHRTLESASFLLLLLEFVPGEDLFYFLEQARDHLDDSSDESVASNTPPTPSLLSTLHPSQLLSRTRLRLVASMFAQMCEAVAAAHAQGVYHRDIKPENFIVTDGYVDHPDGFRERKVIVKLTDFGLSTMDKESPDMDCGSAPYMSYECRNNVAPTYRTDCADVWSLGIVLINMLYHHNPWTDTSQSADALCDSFTAYRRNPIMFFMTRFGGMTRSVADFLSNKVFSILEDGHGPTGASRVTAHDFGFWVNGLADALAPYHIDSAINKRHQRVLSTASSIDHPVSSSSQVSHRPCSRNPSGTNPVIRTPAIRSRSLSRPPSTVGAVVYDHADLGELSTVIDQDIEDSQEDLRLPSQVQPEQEDIQEVFSPEESPSPSRSASTNRRRKRGRKGKGVASSAASTTGAQDETLDMLAQASQSLAREISKQSKNSSLISGTPSGRSRRTGPTEPICLFPVPMAMLSNPMSPPPLPALATSLGRQPSVPAMKSPATATKKTSIWKLSIGKSKGSSITAQSTAAAAPPVEEPQTASAVKSAESQHMSSTASNVTNLLMGLNAPPPANDGTWSRGRRGARDASPDVSSRGPPSRSPASTHSSDRRRGRNTGARAPDVPVPPVPTFSNYANSNSVFTGSNPSAPEPWSAFDAKRGRSPNSYMSSKAPSVASSAASTNWRNSTSTTSSAFTSTSAFTRYSNSSSRSVSTAATSVSGQSWRHKDNTSISSSNSATSSRYHQQYPHIPRNIKIMNGVPEELVTLPRELAGPPKKQRTRKNKDLAQEFPLGTINERPGYLSPDSRSTSQKSPMSLVEDETAVELGGPGKAKSGQINALAKLLSAVRREKA